MSFRLLGTKANIQLPHLPKLYKFIVTESMHFIHGQWTVDIYLCVCFCLHLCLSLLVAVIYLLVMASTYMDISLGIFDADTFSAESAHHPEF